MYIHLASTCFKYQVYKYGSEAITYLNDILWLVTEPAQGHQTAPTPPYRLSSPLYVWQHNLLPFGREL